MSTDIIVPAIIAFVSGYCIYKKTDFFGAFLDGAKDGLYSAASVLPALCLLMTAVGMIRASGALDALASAISPLLDKTVFPTKVLPLALLRPFSGSGALAYYKELCGELSPDSYPARVASVLMGGSETTFYTAAVYFSAVKCKKTRCAIPAALCADCTAWIVCGIVVYLFFGR